MKFLINPFERIAGWQAFFIGFAAMAFTAVVGKINNVAFDGVLDVHTGATFSFSASFAMHAINFLVLFPTMWLAGIFFSKTKPRAIDIAGTVSLARFPMLLLAILCFLPITPENIFDIPRLLIFTFVCMPFIVWMITLMYNAYTVSCHLKGIRAVVSFIGTLLVAEIVSKIIIILLLGSFFTNEPIKNVFSPDSTKNVMVADSMTTIRQKTENVVKAFEHGNFKAITVYFDATMKKALPPIGLKIAWIQTCLTCGKLEKADIDALKETRIDKYDVIEVPLLFARKTLNLRLAFNENGEISGLFFLPVK